MSNSMSRDWIFRIKLWISSGWIIRCLASTKRLKNRPNRSTAQKLSRTTLARIISIITPFPLSKGVTITMRRAWRPSKVTMKILKNLGSTLKYKTNSRSHQNHRSVLVWFKLSLGRKRWLVTRRRWSQLSRAVREWAVRQLLRSET